MGIESVRAGKLASAVALLSIAALFSACDNNDSQRSVSAGGFLAPFPDPGLGVLLDKVDILGPIDPTLLTSQVRDRQANPVFMELLSEERFLFYESQSRAIESVDLCPDPDNCRGNVDPPPVVLHYDSNGLSEAQSAPQASISETVASVRLASGWILSYDANTRSILGFRAQEPVEVIDDSGNLVELGYRVPPRDLAGRVISDNANFGQGSGLVLTEVITGEELLDEVKVNFITRMFEIEPNRVLLFFGQSLPEIHMLEISEVQELRDWDLETPSVPGDPQWDEIQTDIIKGEIVKFPNDPGNPFGPRERAFLTFRTISESVTQNTTVRVDEFQPVIIPQDPPGALLYDAQTFNFMKVVVARNVAGDMIGGVPTTVISNLVFLETLRQSAGITNPDGPFTMGDSLFAPNTTEIWIMEEETNNMICYDYSVLNAFDLDVMDVCVPSTAFSSAFDPQGSDPGLGSGELDLLFATSDVKNNRLVFDRGGDRILSVSYTSSNVAVVARRTDIIQASRDALAEVLLTHPVDAQNVRLFDAQSVSLLEMPIDYAIFPRSF